MHDTVPHELGMFQAGDHAEYPLLLSPLEVGLEAHDVVQGALLVLGPQLDVGPGAVAGVGVHQAHRAQGAKPHGVGTAGSHDLDGHAALVHGHGIGLFAVGVRVGPGALLCPGVKVVQRGTLGRSQRRMERLILGLVEGAVQVVGISAAIAGGGKHLVVVQALGRHDGRHGIVEVQALVAGQGTDLVRQFPVGQGAGGHQDGGAFVDVLHRLAVHGDVGALLHPAGDLRAEGVPVHCQGSAGGHAGHLRRLQQLAAHAAHLFLQQAGRRVQPFGLEAVGADQLRKALALVCGREVHRLLLIQVHLYALTGQPQGRFAARQTGAQNSYFIIAHVVVFSFNPSSAPASQSHSPLWRNRAWSPCGRGWSRTFRTWWPPAYPRS